MLDPQALFSIKLSLKVATFSSLIVFIFGLPISYLLATKDFPFKNLIDALITLPLVFPPTVTGYLLLLVLGKKGVIGAVVYKLFHTGVVFTWYGAVVAASVAAFPIFVKSSRAAIESVDVNLIKVSYTLGKTGLQTFFKVVLPLSRKGVIAALVLSFARALGEFGATLMLAGNIPFKTNTIPLEIYSAVSGGDFQRANILTVITAIISLGIIYAINKLSGDRHGFRDRI